MATERVDVDYKQVLDRIIEFSEKNLNTQSEFLNHIYEVRRRFDNADRDHKDIISDTNEILTLLSNIFDKLKETPNTDILKAVESLKSCSDTMSKKMDDVSHSMAIMNSSVENISDSFTMIKNILGIVSIILVAVQIAVSIYFSTKKNAELKDIITTVMKEIENRDDSTKK